MQYAGLAGIAGCLALIVLGVTIRWGWRLSWLVGWLKGIALLAMLGASVGLAVITWELYQFQPIVDGAHVATLDFQRTGEQHHSLVVETGGETRQLELEGDLWELRVQVLRWRGLLHAIGLDDGYRVHSVSGRYLTLEQQTQSASLTHPLHPTPVWRDAWAWLDRLSFGWVYADAVTLSFMPTADGARYLVEIGATGLSPVAMNAAALTALKGFN